MTPESYFVTCLVGEVVSYMEGLVSIRAKIVAIEKAPLSEKMDLWLLLLEGDDEGTIVNAGLEDIKVGRKAPKLLLKSVQNVIASIKAIRAVTNLGLKDAKQLTDAVCNGVAQLLSYKIVNGQREELSLEEIDTLKATLEANGCICITEAV